MGMDVYGENPKIHTPKPQRPETEDYDSDEMSQYFSDLREWQEKNPGGYFRNNVWWWRPLWVYVAELCDDILTEDDIENGHNNSGHLIDQEKCLIIAKRLVDELQSGRVANYKAARDRQLEVYQKKIAICAMHLESEMMSMFKASATLVMAQEPNHIGIPIILLTRRT